MRPWFAKNSRRRISPRCAPSVHARRPRRGRAGRCRPARACASSARNRRANRMARPRNASSGLTRSRRASATTANSRSPTASSGSRASALQSSPCSASCGRRPAMSSTRRRALSHVVEREGGRRCLIESHPRGTLLHTLRVRERRKRGRNAVEQREPLAFLRGLQLLPVDDDARRAVDRDVTEHVRVTVDHLGAHVDRDITDVEAAVLLHRDRAVHEHLEQQVAELLAQRRGVGGVDRLEHLVGFLEQVRPQAAMRLLAIPRASARCAQPLDDLVERAQRRRPTPHACALDCGCAATRSRARTSRPSSRRIGSSVVCQASPTCSCDGVAVTPRN